MEAPPTLISRAKQMARRMISPSILGWLDYYRFPKFAESWGGPFNGQRFRQQIFNDLLGAVRFDLVVETGTYRGTTTEYMATVSRSPVLTVEADARAYGFSRARLGRFSNITGTNEDSRVFLNRLLDGKELSRRTPFFYLDAHWDADLPLFEELKAIFEKCPVALVMVDDFRVPGDEQYQYDDYGEGKALTDSYIAPLVESLELVQYYPAARAAEETGMRRGCVVLVRKDSGHVESLATVSSIRRWEPGASGSSDDR
jgi:hypothetical protein